MVALPIQIPTFGASSPVINNLSTCYSHHRAMFKPADQDAGRIRRLGMDSQFMLYGNELNVILPPLPEDISLGILMPVAWAQFGRWPEWSSS